MNKLYLIKAFTALLKARRSSSASSSFTKALELDDVTDAPDWNSAAKDSSRLILMGEGNMDDCDVILGAFGAATESGVGEAASAPMGRR